MLKNSHALLIAALTVLASLFSLPADADTRITEQAYAEDVSGTIDFEEAQNSPSSHLSVPLQKAIAIRHIGSG